jgi:hypothetical protein
MRDESWVAKILDAGYWMLDNGKSFADQLRAGLIQ